MGERIDGNKIALELRKKVKIGVDQLKEEKKITPGWYCLKFNV
jgi:hypothetical protein